LYKYHAQHKVNLFEEIRGSAEKFGARIGSFQRLRA